MDLFYLFSFIPCYGPLMKPFLHHQFLRWSIALKDFSRGFNLVLNDLHVGQRQLFQLVDREMSSLMPSTRRNAYCLGRDIIHPKYDRHT